MYLSRLVETPVVTELRLNFVCCLAPGYASLYIRIFSRNLSSPLMLPRSAADDGWNSKKLKTGPVETVWV